MRGAPPNRAWDLASFLAMMLAAVALAAFAAQMAGAFGPRGALPMALDFDAFWSAARIATHRGAATVYDVRAIEAFERAHTALPAPGYLAFYYPPGFLLLCLPLALLPYGAALLAFVGVQAAVLWPALKTILGRHWTWLPVLSCPGFIMNVFSGQNGGLSASCFALALLTLDRAPLAGGACLGLLSFKPQMAVCVPVALLAARRWRAAASAGITALLLAGVATGVLGIGAWRAFLANAPAARVDIETLAIKWPMMQSPYAAMRLAGFSAIAGYAAQAVCAGIALVLLIRICGRRSGAGAEMAALAAAALMVTPYLFDYDLVVMAVPIAWLAGLTWEKPLLLVCYLAPLGARAAGLELGIAIAPPLVLALLVLVYRRAVRA
jgi:alpha-1,2-mannosyltransferase